MAGTIIYAKNIKSLNKKLAPTTPRGARVTISRSPAMDVKAPRGKKAYFVIIDILSRTGRLLYHN